MADAKTSEMFRQAIGLHQRGRLSEAETFYRDILMFCPDAFEARRSASNGDDSAIVLQIRRNISLNRKFSSSYLTRG
jgi:hypothetical protein